MFGSVCLCVDMKISWSDEEMNEGRRLKMNLENDE